MTETMYSFRTREDRPGSANRTGDAQRTTGEMLLRFGITPHFCGFGSLYCGICVRAEREQTGEIPPGGYLRESAMREAIGGGFLNAGAIGTEPFSRARRPTNSEFICTLAELIRDRVRANRA